MAAGNGIIAKIRRRTSFKKPKREPRTYEESTEVQQKLSPCSLKILILGSSGVGKTSICTRFNGHNINGITETTTGHEKFERNVRIRSREEIQYYDLEISTSKGVFQKESINEYKAKISSSDGFCLVYSKDNRQSYMKIIELLSDIYRVKKTKYL